VKSNILVLDNSVVCKPLFKEEGADIVEKIFAKKENFEIMVLLPEIFRFEFFNAAARKKTAEIANAAYESFSEKQVSIIPNEGDLIDKTLRIMKKYPRVSFYDASYHALAIAYDALFVTADKQYYEMTRKEGNVTLLEDLKI